MEYTPLFTIIIPIVHSIEDLKRCLASLEGLIYQRDRFHVVLVDCKVVHGVERFLNENLPKCQYKVTALYLPVKPADRLSWFIEARINEARNYAMRMVPGRYYVFTEDDCTFEPDWLQKFENSLSEEVGALGGPDILPEGMGLFPKALDCVLNSYLGTAGMRRGNGRRARNYYPRKENMAIPAGVIARVGKFSEEISVGGEMDIAKRIRDANLKVVYLSDNPVWHWRTTSFLNFIRLTAYTAFEKVKLMRKHHSFFKSTHFLVLVATIVGTLIGLFSLVSSYARVLSGTLAISYLSALLYTAVFSAIRTRCMIVGLEVYLLIPIHHLSIVFGIIRGATTRMKRTEK